MEVKERMYNKKVNSSTFVSVKIQPKKDRILQGEVFLNLEQSFLQMQQWFSPNKNERRITLSLNYS